MSEKNKEDLVLTLERKNKKIEKPFFREIILEDQVLESVNNIRRAFKTSISARTNLKVQVFFLGEYPADETYFNKIEKKKINIKILIQGDIKSAAEFIREWTRLWIWWYKGYKDIDPIDFFIETAREFGTPKDWWKVKGHIETIEDLTRESLKSDAKELIESLKNNNLALNELREGIPCPLTGKLCSADIKNDPNLVFIAMPIRPEYEDVYRTINNVLDKNDFEAWFAQNNVCKGHILCKICEKIQTSTMGIFEITDLSPNVMLELGLSYGLGKSIMILTKSIKKVPADLKGFEVIKYKNLMDLEKQLAPYLNISKL